MNKYLIFKDKKIILSLFLIVFIASLLRLYKLNTLPGSLYWDEVAIGYNAYSISETLNDEYGNFMPLLFRSFDDYKMPLYIYAVVPVVKIIGLNELSVRLPSAIFGVLTVIVTFFFVKLLFELNYKQASFITPTIIALLSSFLLAISPWHIQFSRGGFEANSALFFIILGTYLFVKGTVQINFLVLSFISFGLAFYSYRSVYVFLPIFIAGIIFLWRKELIRI